MATRNPKRAHINSTSMPNAIVSRRKLLLGSVSIAVLGGGFSFGAHRAVAGNADAFYRLVVDNLDGRQVYNGKPLGPIMRVAAGETLDVELVNNLPPLHDDCTDNPNQPHGLNTTNFHTHGLHVSPTTDSTGEFDADNIFVSVVPEGQIVSCEEICGVDVKSHFRYGRNQFRFEIPENHVSGTFWYHAHKHGSSADQVSDGLAGPLIIDDVPGSMPEYIEQAVEKIFFITSEEVLLVDQDGSAVAPSEFTMRPGEVQRWRVINGSGNGADYAFLRPSISNLEMHLIAFDGLTLDKRVAVNLENLEAPWFNPSALAPGNRADFIVRAPAVLDATTISTAVKSSLDDLANDSNLARFIDLPITVAGSSVAATWSDDDALPGSGLVPFDDIELPKRELAFTRQRTIDLEAFDGEIEKTLQLNAAEDWTVFNRTQVLHVYHIHVNPYLITEIDGETLAVDSPLRRWQDTIGIPLTGSVAFKTRYETFTGKFVIHCHVLPHEDQGMMQVVEVVA
ncbi:Multicopper oxidase with three cupredoxin domains (includes cell division protein FtsP and spore coat protein CotA) [Octadecabacter temperatus]|uniref:Multicopper oxidase mco n=1 Tax=Octadecabacter temperatus TaxID=1458307 RepID=A0A0K0Y2H2_9RHOB|nr:multicopper oxidase domain-containing protein [Octadecabacter temperatus]AKS45134.1 Multicopper oxidase mco [Octadecabacter temperatus]SIN86831.1 Multicopper oxidase with three cupredoxin domains (includes cell division protein FtsP and spore coat protein CotA) [Octadecabacter temperatus]